MSKLKYVHATGSSILPMLTLTDLTLISINDLLFKHQLSPMSGEVKDAIRGLTSRAATAFGAVSQHDNCNYNLKSVFDSYGFCRDINNARIKSEQQLIAELLKLNENGLFNLHKFVADVLHAKQVGLLASNGPLISDSVLRNVTCEIEKLLKIYEIKIQYMYLAVAYLEVTGSKYIRGSVNKGKINSFIQQLVDEGFYLPDFYTAPEKERMDFAQKFLARLIAQFPEIEQDLIVKPNIYATTDITEVDFDLEYFFDSANVHEIFNCVNTKYSNFDAFLYTRGSRENLPKLTEASNIAMIAQITKNLSEVNAKCNFVLDLLNGKIGQKFSPEFCSKFREQFPIAFFLTEEDNNKVKACGYEYRSTQDLVLGQDIKYIGIRPQNLAALQKFLTENNLADKITILDIDTLEVLAKPTPIIRSVAKLTSASPIVPVAAKPPTPIIHTVKSAPAKAAPVLWSAPGVQKQSVMLQVPPVALKPISKALPTQSERKPSELEQAFAKFKRG